MSVNNLIKLSGISPDKLKANELADIVTHYEKLLIPIIQREYPDLPLEDITISLVEIQNGSVDLCFQVNHATNAQVQIISAIQNNQYDSLPRQSIKSLREFTRIAKKHNKSIGFDSQQGHVAEITPTTKIATKISKPKYMRIRGETTLYGKVQRIGGFEPKAILELDEKTQLFCKINADLAKQLAVHLYQWVCVNGIAEWNVENYSIEKFEITEIISVYRNPSPKEAFAMLSKEIGHYYDNVDPLALVESCRGDE